MNLRKFRNGSVLVTSMLVLVLVSAMAVALAGVGGANLQIASNQQHANQAFANAESGLEVMRFWLGRVKVPSSTPPEDYLNTIISLVRDDLQASSVTNLVVNTDGSIPEVTLDSVPGQTFSGQWSADPTNPAILRVTARGTSGDMLRTIRVNFSIDPYRFPIFNYGMATKGPLQFVGNPTLTGAAQDWEADIYVESLSSLVAVEVSGNAQFDGDIDIGNPLANVDFQGDVKIGDDSGATAVDEHVSVLEDDERPEFPVADVQHFLPYATGPVVNSTTDLSGASITLTNATIAAGTNPTFPGNVTIQGILYIEAPNIVTFTHNTTLLGMMVGDGDVNNPGTNAIHFGDPANPSTPSNFASGPLPNGAEFDALRSELGSCILAPGFSVSFWKNFAAINGVVAASGLYFDANASATVNGTLISYSDEPVIVDGNISMNFDRASMVEIPAGFDLLRVLNYNRGSYAVAF